MQHSGSISIPTTNINAKNGLFFMTWAAMRMPLTYRKKNDTDNMPSINTKMTT
jgi:hypothetical protein